MTDPSGTTIGYGMPHASGPAILELRVHGVNNTTPAALLDLPPFDVRQVKGDRRAGFWLAQPDLAPPPGARGHVPPGIRREAYSWGGLVREGAGKTKWLAAIAAAFQVLVLPFSIGNAAMWTRHLVTDRATGAARLWSNVTAGATRVFGLMLTLLFTTTAITVVADVGALQCAGGSSCTFLWQSGWNLFTAVVPEDLRSPARLLAMAVVIVIASVLVLAWLARRARRTYDTLLTRPGAVGEVACDAVDAAKKAGSMAAATDAPALRQPTFWSNQITGRLALAHVAAALALTVGQVAGHVAFVSEAEAGGSPLFAALASAGWLLLLVAAIATAFMPTQTITPPGAAGGRIVAVMAWAPLVLSAAATTTLEVGLWVSQPPAASASGLFAADATPLVLITVAGIIAVSGIWWRQGHRAATAWNGCGPALFMTVSLALAVLTSGPCSDC